MTDEDEVLLSELVSQGLDFLEVRKRIKWVQDQWTTHEWSTRWVGRFANKKETDLSMAASQMLQ
jgi:hypothetical protein